MKARIHLGIFGLILMVCLPLHSLCQSEHEVQITNQLSVEMDQAQKALDQRDLQAAKKHLQLAVAALSLRTAPAERSRCFGLCHHAHLHELDARVFSSFGKSDTIPLDVLLNRLSCLQNSEQEYALELSIFKRFVDSPKAVHDAFTGQTLDTAYRLLVEKKYTQCEQLCRLVESVDPKWAHPHLIHSLLLDRQEKRDAAIVEVQQALKLARVDANRSDQAEYHRTLANYFLGAGKANEALIHSNEALKLSPKNIAILEQQYAIYSAIDSDNAMRVADKLLALSGSPMEKAQALHLKALVLEKKSHFQQSATLCKQAIELAPTSLEPHLTLFSALINLTRLTEASALAEEYYRQNKSHLSADDLHRIANEFSSENCIAIQCSRQSFTSTVAATFLRRAQTLEPKNPKYREAYRSRSDAYAPFIYRLVVQDHNYGKAIEIFKQAGSNPNQSNELAVKILQKIPSNHCWEYFALATVTICLLKQEPPKAQNVQTLSRLSAVACDQFDAALDIRLMSINAPVIEFLEELSRRSIAGPLQCRQLIISYACCDELSTALTKANQFVLRFPADEELRLLRATLHLRTGNEKLALADLRSLSQSKRYSIEDLRSQHRLCEHYLVRDKLFERTWSKKSEETDKHFEREQQYYLAKASTESSNEDRKQMQYLAARMAIAREQFQEALTILGKVEPLDCTGYELKSWCLQLLNRLEEATQCRQKVIELWRKGSRRK